MRTLFFIVLILGMDGYITLSAYRAFFSGGNSKLPKPLQYVISALPAVAALVLACVTGNLAAAVIALAHLTALLVLWDIALLLVRSDRINPQKWKSALLAASIVLCTVYITYGAINAYVVTPTFYTIETDRPIGVQNLRVAHVSDCHLGTTFNGDGFARYISAINTQQPDLLVITGDFIDSRTSAEDMARACEALGNVKAPLGVFYVAGNHENNLNSHKVYELHRLMEHQGVTVLEDETAVPTDGLVICGRRDAYDRSRKSVSELIGSRSESDYWIFLDHQPGEYRAYAAQGADLVLSGHTHAGQMFPLGMFIEAIGMGENTYGLEKHGSTSFIVSSGISGLIPLRTEAKSEYVIIDIVSPQI